MKIYIIQYCTGGYNGLEDVYDYAYKSESDAKEKARELNRLTGNDLHQVIELILI